MIPPGKILGILNHMLDLSLLGQLSDTAIGVTEQVG